MFGQGSGADPVVNFPYAYFRYFTAEIIPLDSTTQPLNLKPYEIVTSVVSVTEQIHGEFGAAAIKNGLEGKNTYHHTDIGRILQNIFQIMSS